MTEDTKKAEKSSSCSGFNYCFWSKFIVGIPALAICAYAVAMRFQEPLMQSIAWITTVLVLVWVAMKVEKMPALQKKVFPRKDS